MNLQVSPTDSPTAESSPHWEHVCTRFNHQLQSTNATFRSSACVQEEFPTYLLEGGRAEENVVNGRILCLCMRVGSCVWVALCVFTVTFCDIRVNPDVDQEVRLAWTLVQAGETVIYFPISTWQISYIFPAANQQSSEGGHGDLGRPDLTCSSCTLVQIPVSSPRKTLTPSW